VNATIYFEVFEEDKFTISDNSVSRALAILRRVLTVGLVRPVSNRWTAFSSIPDLTAKH